MPLCSDIIIEPGLAPRRQQELNALADTLLAGRLPEDARPVYTGRNKLYVCRLADGLEVNIKQFRRCSLLKGLIYGRLRRNKALRSLLNARRLRSLGFDSPEPLMACWTRSAGGWCLRSAYYVCAQLDDVRETRCWEEWPDRGPFTDALGREMARLFRAGVLFRDFSPGNVLLRNDTAPGDYRFVYVDVNRTDFGVRSRRRLMSMFQRINIVEAETERLAAALARAMGWNERDTRLRALGVLRRFLWKKDTIQKPVKRFLRSLVGKR
ncbi:MAG: lipopolysaccharide kinase InaA family protein [Muribaculaceae bacterium]|nr:lipopolysaccharide kinase InaA family protein [Muribaculaceae bacterium]